MRFFHKRSAGFTLIEAVMVIVITGIIAGVVAVFITKPVTGYVDAVRRAELTDAADVALRRLARDVRLALPNSLRTGSSGGVNYIEFIMTSAGGRYRDVADPSTGGNPLSFTSGTALTFDVLGAANPPIAADDYIIVYNLGENYAPADVYNGGNRAKVASVSGNTVTLTSPTNPFGTQSPPLPSPSNRFQVVPGGVRAVTYSCPDVSSTPGNFNRIANYGFNPSLEKPPTGGSTALVAERATCTVAYTASDASARNGLLSITLTLADSSGTESVSLFRQIHVDNSP